MYKKTYRDMVSGETTPTIVTTEWLKDSLKSGWTNLRIIDGTFHMENSGRDARAEYTKQHIPGATYFDINGCADTTSQYDLPHMLPSVEQFEEYVGSRGIDNESHVVVYDNNPMFPVFSAQRVWWTFRCFGHDKVSILEGGLQKWLKAGGTVTEEASEMKRGVFKAQFRSNLVKSFDDVLSNVKSGEYVLIDARPPGRFQGTAPEPIPGVKPGHIPQALNVPFVKLMDTESKTYKSVDELKKIFEDNNVDLKKPIIFTCGSGLQASNLVLASYLCGKEDAAMYDGSWVEWYRRAPADQMVDVPSE
ncbi:3-mercaptopyruvate sulfurtransferase [Aplysia californica]|uniref:Sulfurtransferase n=1 Tax=Aplysia californica TaxID=6500 RepID=A0ABM0JTU9_APLCA|nr:3-mercaptopyruvate sulfurtransferase [Aplysia californica]